MDRKAGLQKDNGENADRKNGRKPLILYIAVMLATVLLNVLAWSSTAFCDLYIAHVFPVWVNTYGRVMGVFPFSVGEWLLIAGILLLVSAGSLAVICGVAAAVRRIRKKGSSAEKNRFFAGCARFYRFFAWVVLIVCVIMTLNCSLLYHASSFSEKYFGRDTEEYSLEDLLRVRNHVAAQCNRLCGEVARKDDGTIAYTQSLSEAGKAVDMADKARESMRRLGAEYPQLDGYYPRPKPLFFSDFMCQQYMLGWYFPFSMEANYNKVAYVMNQPSSMCHELAHLRGYIYEDEANFISYLACVQSDDIYFQYSGYLNVLGYLERDLQSAALHDPEAFVAACRKEAPVQIADRVYPNDVFVTDAEWERINKKALLDTEIVDKATDTFVDTTLKVNGVSDGKISYSRVVRLMLQYYSRKGEL